MKIEKIEYEGNDLSLKRLNMITEIEISKLFNEIYCGNNDVIFEDLYIGVDVEEFNFIDENKNKFKVFYQDEKLDVDLISTFPYAIKIKNLETILRIYAIEIRFTYNTKMDHDEKIKKSLYMR